MKRLANDVVAVLKEMNIDAECIEVNKNGVNKIGISVHVGYNREISPVFYIDNFMEFDCHTIASKILSELPKAIAEVSNIDVSSRISDKEYVLDNIYIGLERENDNQIIKMPSPFNNIQQYIYVRLNDEMRTKVTDEFLRNIGVSETDAWLHALANTRANTSISKFGDMVVITNKTGSFGAASALINETIREVCESYLNKTKIVLVPSSVHEFICLPFDESTDIKHLKELIIDANNEVVDAIEQLGDEPYVVDINFGY